MIQVKYGDTKSQLANILTKGSLTHDRWDRLLRWLFSCAGTFSNWWRQGHVQVPHAGKRTRRRGFSQSRRCATCAWSCRFARSHCDHLKMAEVRVLLHQAHGDLPCWHQTMKQRISPKRQSVMEQQNGARGNSRHNFLQIWETSFVTPHSKQRSEHDQHQDDTDRISKNWRNWRQTWCSSVPSQWSLVEDLHDSCMWATVHLSKDDWVQFQRVPRNIDVVSIEKVFTTVQKLTVKSVCLERFSAMSWWKMSKKSLVGSDLGAGKNGICRRIWSTSWTLWHCSHTPRYSSSKKFRRWWSTRTRDIRFSGRAHHLHVVVERYWLEPKEQWRHLQKEIHHSVSFLPEDYRLGAGHFSALEMRKGVVGPCRGRLKETGTTPPKILKGGRRNFVHYIASSETAEQFAENTYCRYWAQYLRSRISFLIGFIQDLCFLWIILRRDKESSTKSFQDAAIQACAELKWFRTDHQREISLPLVV